MENRINPLAVSTRNPLGLEVVKAEGDFLIDASGKKYLDFISGISVSNLGHQHPKIKQAIQEQLDKFSFVMVFGEYELEPQRKLAAKLKEICPKNLNSTYLLSTGSEANEAAIKLTRRVTGREKIISFHGAYHGSTMGSLSIGGNENKKSVFRPLLPGIKQIRFNSIEDLSHIDDSVAGVIVEPIQGDAGIRIPSQEFMKALRQKCSASGALLIFDEIQIGLGRTGKMFAFEHFGIEPDILTLGKALGGGLPLSALVSSSEILSAFKSNPELGHISTHGGNPLACAASLAYLEEISMPGFLDGVNERSEFLKSEMEKLPFKEVRSKGLLFALEMKDPDQVQKMVKSCLAEGLISFWFLSSPNAFRVAPPLNIEPENLNSGIQIIKRQLRKVLG